MGLYRNDGLILIRNPKGSKIDSCRKRISNALKLRGFKITIHTNLKIIKFLDLTLKGTYEHIHKGTYEHIHKGTYTKAHTNTYTKAHTNLIKEIMTHQCTYTLLQTTHPQLPYKSQNLSAVYYPATLLTSIFLTNTNTYITKHSNTAVIDRH